ncbi:hypothetical protein PI125_g18391 [Phytophthora idaei]|nr:hypothetical protein PI125_g18391 [Phytophthora idaei]
MDTNETAWVSIRPLNDGSKSRTLMELCSRQAPVPYRTANTTDPAVKGFQKMMEDAVAEDAQTVADKLEKLLRADVAAMSSPEYDLSTIR